MNIIIDPGHGGIDNNGNYTTAPNKMFKFSDDFIMYEGEINRRIAKELLKYFQQNNHDNIKVMFTVEPNDSKDLSLSQRVDVANKFNPNNTLFISIHCNAGGGTGFEIFTSIGQTKSDELASYIFDSLYNTYNKYALPMRKDLVDNDVDKESNFYVLRKTLCAAVLCEYGFFDNRKDAKLLKDINFIKEIAQNTYCGIMNYINSL